MKEVKPGDLITADLFNDISDEIETLSEGFAKFLTAMTIDRNGNVGIGTTKPLSKLDVYQGDLHVGAKFGDGDTSSRFIRVETMTPGEPSLELSRGGNWAAKLLVTETSFRIRDFSGHVDGKDLVTILNTGSVGIGTTEPTDKLHVEGGFIKTRIFPDNDSTAGLTGFSLESREKGGGTHTWKIFTAPVGGGHGVPVNSLTFWEYDNIGCKEGGNLPPKIGFAGKYRQCRHRDGESIFQTSCGI